MKEILIVKIQAEKIQINIVNIIKREKSLIKDLIINIKTINTIKSEKMATKNQIKDLEDHKRLVKTCREIMKKEKNNSCNNNSQRKRVQTQKVTQALKLHNKIMKIDMKIINLIKKKNNSKLKKIIR